MKIRKEYGFSLIELLIAMAIFSIVIASAYGVYISSSRTTTTQNVAAGVQQTVRVGLELMAQDIRMAGYDPAGADIAAIELAEDHKIRVTSDRNYNDDPLIGAINISGSIENSDFERITYMLSSDQLQRILYEGSANSKAETLIENVTELRFEYLDDEGDSGATSSDIRAVNILLEVEEPAGLGNPVSRQLETTVFCRNLVE